MSLYIAKTLVFTLTSNRSMETTRRLHHNLHDGRGGGETTVAAPCTKYSTHTGKECQGDKHHSHTGAGGFTTTTNQKRNTDCITPVKIYNSLRNINKPDNFLEAAYVIFTTLW